MGTKGIETAQSLDRFLNRNVLFVQGIDQNVPKTEVLQVLNQVCKQPQQGRIDILMSPDGKMRGTAFLNFHNKEDAKASLDKWRFGLELRGRPLRMQYSSDREFKDVIQGPLVARFKILIRNLPEELEPDELFDKFSEYGEILQLHNSCDHYGQYYAIIQYMDVSSVNVAIRAANRERMYNHVLLVEAYKPSATYGLLPRNVNQAQAPQPAVTVSNSASSGTTGYRSGGGATQLQGMTYAALQQQQEHERGQGRPHDDGHERDVGGHTGGGDGFADTSGAAAAATSNGGSSSTMTAAAGASTYASGSAAAQQQQAPLAVPSFDPAAPAGPLGGAMAGSLQSLLTTALHHVHMLDELLCCPITQEQLVDPVVAADGNTYERLAIEAWLAKHNTSPLTNQVLPNKSLTPNNLLRKIAEELQGTGAADVYGTPPTMYPADADDAAAAAAAEEAAMPPAPVPVPVSPPSATVYYQQQQQQPQQQQPPQPKPTPMQYVQVEQYMQPAAQQPAPQQQQPSPQYAVQHHQLVPQQQVQQQRQIQQQQIQQFMVPVQMQSLQQQHLQYAQPPPTSQQQYQVQGTTYYAYRPAGM